MSNIRRFHQNQLPPSNQNPKHLTRQNQKCIPKEMITQNRKIPNHRSLMATKNYIIGSLMARGTT